MLNVTENASRELQKVLTSDAHANERLILYFIGAG